MFLCFQNAAQQHFRWNGMNEREAWETEFQRLFLAPIFSDTANRINQAQTIMINAGKLTEKPLERLEKVLRKFYEHCFKTV